MVKLITLLPALVQLLALLPSTQAFLPTPSHTRVSSSPRVNDCTSNRVTSLPKLSPLKSTSSNDEEFQGFGNVGFLILAGGTGSRMKANMPKQFLTLRSAPVLHYSLDLFLQKLPAYCAENNLSPPALVVLVLDPKYQEEYQPIVDKFADKLAFANPGKERQGSVENGLNKLVELDPSCKFIAVHDSARPLVTIPEIINVVSDAVQHGSAVLGVPCKATIKESEDGAFVARTIPRERLWEVHTPQVVKIEALLRGFEKVEAENLEVTDDVSIIEALGEPVKLTRGEYTNLKITTPEDMDVAGAILEDRGQGDVKLL
jgi:2-C-methyl-D-erythritol 4-phosphate cytidylyltransferase